MRDLFNISNDNFGGQGRPHNPTINPSTGRPFGGQGY